MNVKLVIEGITWNILSVYAPQVGCSREEKEVFWQQLEALMKTFPPQEQIFLGGDLNGHVGRNNRGNKRWHGSFGVGQRNDEGDEIIQFAKSFDMVIIHGGQSFIDVLRPFQNLQSEGISHISVIEVHQNRY